MKTYLITAAPVLLAPTLCIICSKKYPEILLAIWIADLRRNLET